MLKVKHIAYQSETSMCLYFGDRVETQLSLEIAQFSELIRADIQGLIELIPGATSLYVEYDPRATNPDLLEREICEKLSTFKFRTDISKHLELPIYYHPEVAPDLAYLADKNNLTIEQVIEIHSGASYTVTSLGFAPGFAYLAGLDARLVTPRLTTPKNVTAGSLGIADSQTAIYPDHSPGGWSIIGNCPVALYHLNKNPITPFKVGMTIVFKPITRDRFIELGGQV